MPTQTVDQDLVADLLNAALAVMDTDRDEARRRVLDARRVLVGNRVAHPGGGGCLASWQMKRIDRIVQDGLSGRLRIDHVADALKLSPCYLSRAFKATAGVTYSEFVQEARVRLGKRLLLTSDATLAEIALLCGLADQSHFTRLFKRSTGLTPGAWRKQFVDARGATDSGAPAPKSTRPAATPPRLSRPAPAAFVATAHGG